MLKLWSDLFLLGIESQQVVWLRTMKIALGGAAGEKEVRRMLSEKLSAAGEAGISIASGKTAASVVSGYRRKVKANRRRLSR